MEHQQAIQESRSNMLVEENKFDKHMRKARVQDIDSRKAIFNTQTEDRISRAEGRRNIQSAIY